MPNGKPEGKLCIFDLKQMGAVCQEIDPLAGQLKKQGASVEFIKVDQLNNYVMVSPETWGNIQAYIQKMKLLNEQQKR